MIQPSWGRFSNSRRMARSLEAPNENFSESSSQLPPVTSADQPGNLPWPNQPENELERFTYQLLLQIPATVGDTSTEVNQEVPSGSHKSDWELDEIDIDSYLFGFTQEGRNFEQESHLFSPPGDCQVVASHPHDYLTEEFPHLVENVGSRVTQLELNEGEREILEENECDIMENDVLDDSDFLLSPSALISSSSYGLEEDMKELMEETMEAEGREFIWWEVLSEDDGGLPEIEGNQDSFSNQGSSNQNSPLREMTSTEEVEKNRITTEKEGVGIQREGKKKVDGDEETEENNNDDVLAFDSESEWKKCGKTAPIPIPGVLEKRREKNDEKIGEQNEDLFEGKSIISRVSPTEFFKTLADGRSKNGSLSRSQSLPYSSSPLCHKSPRDQKINEKGENDEVQENVLLTSSSSFPGPSCERRLKRGIEEDEKDDHLKKRFMQTWRMWVQTQLGDLEKKSQDSNTERSGESGKE